MHLCGIFQPRPSIWCGPRSPWDVVAWQSRVPGLFLTARAPGVCIRGEAGLGSRVEAWTSNRELHAGLVLQSSSVLDVLGGIQHRS